MDLSVVHMDMAKTGDVAFANDALKPKTKQLPSRGREGVTSQPACQLANRPACLLGLASFGLAKSVRP